MLHDYALEDILYVLHREIKPVEREVTRSPFTIESEYGKVEEQIRLKFAKAKA